VEKYKRTYRRKRKTQNLKFGKKLGRCKMQDAAESHGDYFFSISQRCDLFLILAVISFVISLREALE